MSFRVSHRAWWLGDRALASTYRSTAHKALVHGSSGAEPGCSRSIRVEAEVDPPTSQGWESESWRKGGITERLSDAFHTSRSSARGSFPLLLASTNGKPASNKPPSISVSGSVWQPRITLHSMESGQGEGKRCSIKNSDERKGELDPQPTPDVEDEPVETETS